MDSTATQYTVDCLGGAARKLMASPTVAIRSNGHGFRISPGRQRWLTASGPLALAVLLILITVAGMASGGLLRGLAVALIIVPLALFLLWGGLKLALCNGSVIWDDNSSDVEIRCRGMFRTRVARLPKRCVSFKAYMNTAHQKSPRLRYGDYVLALVVTSTDGLSQVVIAVLEKEAEFLKTVRALRRLLPTVQCDYPEGATGTANRRSIGEEWDRLVKRYERKTFFGTMSITTAAAEQGFAMTCGWGRRVVGAISLAIGLCFLLPLVLLLRTHGLHGLGGALYLLPIGAMASYQGLILLSSAQRIIVDRLSGHLELRFGHVPFATKLIVMKERLKVNLGHCSTRTATHEFSVGDNVLSLHADTDPDQKLVLSSGSHASLKEAYMVLTTFLGQHNSTDTLCEQLTEDGRMVRFSATAIGGTVSGNERLFNRVSPELAAFRGTLGGLWLWVVSTGLGLFLAVMPFFLGSEKGLEEKIPLLVACPFGIFMSATSVYVVIRFFMRRCVVADKRSGMLHFASSLRGFSLSQDICRLSEIAAVQVCSTTGLIVRPTQRAVRIVHEINVVGYRKEDDRARVSCYADRDKAYMDAEAFARFVDVMLVDNAE